MTSAALARIAARSLVARSTCRRSAAASALSKQQYSSSAVALGGATPPLAPFARLPLESEKMVEQYDAIWDDGVAPEVTLDFDCQHISSAEGLAMWLGGLGFFATVYQLVKLTDPGSKNPAINRTQMGSVDEGLDLAGAWTRLKTE